MPIEYSIVADDNLVITRFHGIVTDFDLKSTYAAIFRQPGLSPGFRELSLHEFDFAPTVTTKGLRRQIEMAKEYHGSADVRSAAVVGTVAHEIFLEYVRTNIDSSPLAEERLAFFTSADEALVHLGINPSSVPLPTAHRVDFDHQLSYSVLQRRLETSEREREAAIAFRDALFQQSDATAVLDLHTGAICEFNDMFCRLMGVGPEEVFDLKVGDLEIDQSDDEGLRRFEQILGQGSATFETRYRTRQGTVLDVLVSAWHVRAGARDYIQSVYVDVSDSKRQERELAAKNTELSSTLEKLEQSLDERTRAQRRISRQREILDTIGRILRGFVSDEHENEVFDQVLLAVLSLTQSRYGSSSLWSRRTTAGHTSRRWRSPTSPGTRSRGASTKRRRRRVCVSTTSIRCSAKRRRRARS